MVNYLSADIATRKGCAWQIKLRKYSRGRRGAPAKGIGRATGARVQIPLSSPYMVLWSSGLSRLPVTEKIASSNLVRTAITCECSSMVERHLAKVDTAVRFCSLALLFIIQKLVYKKIMTIIELF